MLFCDTSFQANLINIKKCLLVETIKPTFWQLAEQQRKNKIKGFFACTFYQLAQNFFTIDYFSVLAVKSGTGISN